jgi:dTDP-4-dehydrorhamnose 3,5-epimerase
MYSVDSEWYPGGEYGIAWNDPDLGIKWKVSRPLLSEKDQQNPSLRSLFQDRFSRDVLAEG